MKGFTIVLLLFLVFFQALGQKQVILIVADDLGWKDVGFNGSAYYDTPNLDALAKKSILYKRAYANASNCAPSRACLMTGQYAPRHEVYTVAPSARGNVKTRKIIPTPTRSTLKPDVLTLGNLFQNAGYATGVFGKWHIGNDPTLQGFDVHKGGGRSGHPKTYFSPYSLKYLDDGPEGEYLTDRITDEAISFMDKHKQDDFFLYLPHFAIHTPLQSKESDRDLYKGKPQKEGQGKNADYVAMVKNLDDNVGRILKSIKQLELNDPLIIFSSDNGGIANLSRQWPLRAGKGSYYEGGIRVPLLVHHPTFKPAVTQSPVLLFDIFPSLCEWAGLSVPYDHSVDAISLLSHWETGNLKVNSERSLFFHFPFYLQAYARGRDDSRDDLFRTRPGSVVIKGNWKLHHYFEDNAFELYDLANDQGERIDLSKYQHSKLLELQKELKEWRAVMNAPIPQALNPSFDPSFIPPNGKR